MDKGIQRRLLALSGSMGFLMYGLGYSVPLVRKDLGVSRAIASLHQLTFAALLMISSLYLAKFISKYSPTFAMRSGWVVVIIGMLLFAWGPSIWVTVPAFGLCAVGATLFNNTNSATLGMAKGSTLKLMLRTTGIATASGTCAPTIIGALESHGISWRLTLVAFALIVGWISLKQVPEVPNRSPISDKTRIAFNKDYSLMIALGLTANFMEAGVGAWALDLLISRDIRRSSALILAALISFGVATSRLGFSFRSTLGPSRIWLISSLLTGIGLLIIIATSNGSLTMVGLVIATLGIGPLGGIALTFASDSPNGADIGISANVIGTAISIGVGPWLVGLISDGYGFSWAYWLPVGMLFIASMLYYIVRKVRSKG